MVRKVITGRPDMSCKEAAAVMMKEHVGALPVVAENGQIQGIVTRTDLIRTYAPAAPQKRSMPATQS
jgi:CBS domain-containing protein